MAPQVTLVHCLEATAQDDALNVLDMLLRDLFSKAEQVDRKTRPRKPRDLDKAARLMTRFLGARWLARLKFHGW